MEESERRASFSIFCQIKSWIENDIELEWDLIDPNYIPIDYFKISLCWAFYYLQHEFQYYDALKDILSKGGDMMANAAIVGGLIGAAGGIDSID